MVRAFLLTLRLLFLKSKHPREPAPIYSYKRVQPGDVGYIRRGRFHLLFSAGCPLGSRRLGVEVPDTFEPLDVGRLIYGQPRLPGWYSGRAMAGGQRR